MRPIAPDETEIVAHQEPVQGPVSANSNWMRIIELEDNYLVKIASDSSGWETLYRDPNDGRLWECTYPHSKWHGGGPPLLRCLSLEEAKAKYGDKAVSGDVSP